ncbi:hypothetical protein AB4Y45_33615 [Paraburkholderia sp. EG287A]|uniref:hypothetical protein n=1 Tax=Paraburkholderia sp. EG287A TaxID=3237012 RepID=UPI0034D26165
MTDQDIVKEGIRLAERLYRFKFELGDSNKNEHGRSPEPRVLPDFLTTTDKKCLECWEMAAGMMLLADEKLDLKAAVLRLAEPRERDDVEYLEPGFTHRHIAALERAAEGKCSCVPRAGLRKHHEAGCEVQLLAQIADSLYLEQYRLHLTPISRQT